MLQGLLAKFSRKIKTKRRSPLDCADFFDVAPVAPTHAQIRAVVAQRLYGSKPPAASEAENDQRDYAIRATTFDLQYRCGAAGRCIGSSEGGQSVPACRFPCCFTLRPLTKGAEIMAERAAYEVKETPDAEIKALVEMALDDNLEKCANAIQDLADRKIQSNTTNGKPLSLAMTPNEADPHPAAPKVGESSRLFGQNPLKNNEALREEVIALYLWRAALLVNLRKDEQAVNSLINLSFLVEKESRLKLLVAAAGWAALNDMEIVYYRSFIQLFDKLPIANDYAHNRQTLLRRVVEACGSDGYFVEHVVHTTFAKEITALVSRAQASQTHGDTTEDPMNTMCIPLALQYYRFYISPEFWNHYFNLMVMPPATSSEENPSDPLLELKLTPPHVLDSIGRSIMLHHLMVLHDGREKERASGDLLNREVKSALAPEDKDFARMESILDARQAAIAATRLRQLLSTIKGGDAATALGKQQARPELQQQTRTAEGEDSKK